MPSPGGAAFGHVDPTAQFAPRWGVLPLIGFYLIGYLLLIAGGVALSAAGLGGPALLVMFWIPIGIGAAAFHLFDYLVEIRGFKRFAARLIAVPFFLGCLAIPPVGIILASIANALAHHHEL